MREIGLVIFNCLPAVELDLIMSHNGGQLVKRGTDRITKVEYSRKVNENLGKYWNRSYVRLYK